MKIVRVLFWELPESALWAFPIQAKGPGRWDPLVDVVSRSGFASFEEAMQDAVIASSEWQRTQEQGV